MRPAIKNIFCDRDGTIIYDRHYLADPAGVELLPGAAEGLARLGGQGLKLFVVTNQSGIERGFYSLETYQACQDKMAADLAVAGVTLTDCAFCPHAPADGPGLSGCNCRKPATGMWEQLRDRYSLRPEESVMIGDKPVDIAFGRRASFAATILVLSGKGEKSALELGLPTDPRSFPAGSYFDVSLSLPAKKLEFPDVVPDCLAVNLSGAADYLAAVRAAV